MKYEIRSLQDIPFKAVHRCFVRAFEDYAVGVGDLPESGLLRRARKNSWAPDLSFGVLERGSLVAITLIGVDEITGELRGYDIATGIVSEHRGKGLAGELIDAIIPELQARDIAALQLEVLQQNSAAIRAYEKAGFSRSRALDSLQGTAQSVHAPAAAVEVHPISAATVCELSPELNFEPSFEQRDQAIHLLGEDLLMLGVIEDNTCVSAIAFDPQTHWLMRLVTRSEYRKRGYACSLLGSLAESVAAKTPIKAVNVDENDTATLKLLSKCGLADSLSQWEMRLDL